MGIYCYLIAVILTKLLQKGFLNGLKKKKKKKKKKKTYFVVTSMHLITFLTKIVLTSRRGEFIKRRY